MSLHSSWELAGIIHWKTRRRAAYLLSICAIFSNIYEYVGKVSKVWAGFTHCGWDRTSMQISVVFELTAATSILIVNCCLAATLRLLAIKMLLVQLQIAPLLHVHVKSIQKYLNKSLKIPQVVNVSQQGFSYLHTVTTCLSSPFLCRNTQSAQTIYVCYQTG